MFTGIVQKVGLIIKSWMEGSKKVCWIRSDFTDFAIGESISVDGVCLTIVAIEGQDFCCELSSETLARSVAQGYQVDSMVNLERALRIGDRLSGHFVLGHVDQVMHCSNIHKQDGCWSVTFSGATPEHVKYLVQKGSVTVNGVSLTINALHQDGFTVMLIPHTLQETNLQQLEISTRVNIEFDYLCRIVLNNHFERATS